MNWRISSRMAISAFASAATALRTMINRLTIRFPLKGVRTILLTHTLPVAVFVHLLDKVCLTPARALKPPPRVILVRT